MKKIIIATVILVSLFSCTKYNYEDTGLAKGQFNGTMYDYLSADTYNWDTIRKMIVRAGLKDIFEGKNPEYKDGFTFFGPTNHTLRTWMRVHEYNQWGVIIATKNLTVEEVSIEDCKSIVMRHIVKGIHMRDDIPRGKPNNNNLGIGTGGIHFNEGGDYPIWAYSYKLPHQGIPDAGAVVLFLVSHKTGQTIDVASTNIETNTGVVHSLSYSYRIPQL